jgi:hypothetical protein
VKEQEGRKLGIGSPWTKEISKIQKRNIYFSDKGEGRRIYPCNRPWREIGLLDIKAPIFSR